MILKPDTEDNTDYCRKENYLPALHGRDNKETKQIHSRNGGHRHLLFLEYMHTYNAQSSPNIYCHRPSVE